MGVVGVIEAGLRVSGAANRIDLERADLPVRRNGPHQEEDGDQAEEEQQEADLATPAPVILFVLSRAQRRIRIHRHDGADRDEGLIQIGGVVSDGLDRKNLLGLGLSIGQTCGVVSDGKRVFRLSGLSSGCLSRRCGGRLRQRLSSFCRRGIRRFYRRSFRRYVRIGRGRRPGAGIIRRSSIDWLRPTNQLGEARVQLLLVGAGSVVLRRTPGNEAHLRPTLPATDYDPCFARGRSAMAL